MSDPVHRRPHPVWLALNQQEEGRRAHAEGRGREANRYAPGTPAAAYWDQGWTRAAIAAAARLAVGMAPVNGSGRPPRWRRFVAWARDALWHRRR